MLALMEVVRKVGLMPEDTQLPLRSPEYWDTPDFATGSK